MRKRIQPMLATSRFYLSGLVEVCVDILLEPIVFAFALLLIFSHIQTVLEKSYSTPEFWSLLEGDMLEHPTVYIIFLVVFFVWVVFKLKRNIKEFEQGKEQTSELRGINQKLDMLIDEIRQDRNERNRKR